VLAPLLALALTAPWRPDAPKTHEIDLPRFRIQATDKALGMANLLAAELEQDRDVIARRLGGDYTGVTEVRVGEGLEELLRLELPADEPPRWAAGLAHPRENLILLDAGALRPPGGPGVVLHELAHLAVSQLGRPDMPRWFQEGMAVRAAGESSPEASLALVRAADGRAIPLDDLERGFPEGYGEVQLAYAESKDFVDYLYAVHDGDPRPVLGFLQAVHDGQPFDAAFAGAFGAPRGELEARWLKQVAQRFKWIPLFTGSSMLFALTSLLCIAAWARVRRRRSVRLSELALEEQAQLAAERIRAAEEALPQPGATVEEPPAIKPTLH
jgi:hypothetical protein